MIIKFNLAFFRHLQPKSHAFSDQTIYKNRLQEDRARKTEDFHFAFKINVFTSTLKLGKKIEVLRLLM